MQGNLPSARQSTFMNFSDIVLVPFDDLTVFHCRGLDRHEFIEPIAGEDKAAWMLGQVARRPSIRGRDRA